MQHLSIPGREAIGCRHRKRANYPAIVRDLRELPAAASSGLTGFLTAAQYTLILLASKALPKQCVDYISGKVKTRRTVGVRLVNDPVCLVRLLEP